MRASNPNQPVPLCSVLELRKGARAVVRAFAGDDVEATRALARRLVAMGLPIGCEAEVLVQRGRGPILLRARETRIALGQDEARCVRVEALGTESLGTESLGTESLGTGPLGTGPLGR